MDQELHKIKEKENKFKYPINFKNQDSSIPLQISTNYHQVRCKYVSYCKYTYQSLIIKIKAFSIIQRILNIIIIISYSNE